MGWLKKFGPAQNILGPAKGQGINTKKIIFWSGTKSLGRAQYLNKFWCDTKAAQTILESVEGQGKSIDISSKCKEDFLVIDPLHFD